MDNKERLKDNYYPNSIIKITQSALSDYYYREFSRNNHSKIDLPKFPSKKHSTKNFRYILNEIMHRA